MCAQLTSSFKYAIYTFYSKTSLWVTILLQKHNIPRFTSKFLIWQNINFIIDPDKKLYFFKYSFYIYYSLVDKSIV